MNEYDGWDSEQQLKSASSHYITWWSWIRVVLQNEGEGKKKKKKWNKVRERNEGKKWRGNRSMKKESSSIPPLIRHHQRCTSRTWASNLRLKLVSRTCVSNLCLIHERQKCSTPPVLDPRSIHFTPVHQVVDERLIVRIADSSEYLLSEECILGTFLVRSSYILGTFFV